MTFSPFFGDGANGAVRIVALHSMQDFRWRASAQ